MDQLPVDVLIKIGYVEVLVQCPQCQMYTRRDAPNCESCRAPLPPPSPDGLIFLAVRGERDEERYRRTTRFVECPNCRKLLQVGTDTCPECREEIDEGYALRNSLTRVLTAQAVNAAETAAGTRFIAPLVVAASAGAFWLSGEGALLLLFYFTLLLSVACALWSLGWMRRYGWLPLKDEDFLSGRRKVKSTLLLWLGLLAAQLLAAALRPSLLS